MYTTTTVKVTEKGQIVLPKEMRKSMGINATSKVVLTQSKNKIILTKKPSDESIANFPELVAASQEVLRKVWENEDDKLWESYLKD